MGRALATIGLVLALALPAPALAQDCPDTGQADCDGDGSTCESNDQGWASLLLLPPLWWRRRR